MDNIQAFAAQHLPPGLLQHVTTHSSTYWAIYQQVVAVHNALHSFAQMLWSGVLLPIVARVSSSPDIATIAVLVLIAIVSWQVLNMAFRALFFWIRLVVRLAFWIALLSLGIWLYQRGVDGAAQDLGHLRRVWTAEYQYWQRQDAAARRGRYLRSQWPS